MDMIYLYEYDNKCCLSTSPSLYQSRTPEVYLRPSWLILTK